MDRRRPRSQCQRRVEYRSAEQGCSCNCRSRQTNQLALDQISTESIQHRCKRPRERRRPYADAIGLSARKNGHADKPSNQSHRAPGSNGLTEENQGNERCEHDRSGVGYCADTCRRTLSSPRKQHKGNRRVDDPDTREPQPQTQIELATRAPQKRHQDQRAQKQPYLNQREGTKVLCRHSLKQEGSTPDSAQQQQFDGREPRIGRRRLAGTCHWNCRRLRSRHDEAHLWVGEFGR